MPLERLSDALVERLAVRPGDKRTAYFDEDRAAPRGFCVRVTASGKKSYYYVATVPETKTKVWVQLGSAAKISLGKARKLAKAKAGDIAKGTNPNAVSRQQRAQAREEKLAAGRTASEPTLAGLVLRHIEARESRLSPITAKEYRRTLREDIESQAIGAMKAKDVLRSHVREWHAKIAKGGKHQADRGLVLMRAAYRWGQEEELAVDVPLVDRDPTRGVERVATGSLAVRTRALVDGKTHDEKVAWREVVQFWKGTEGMKLVPRAFVRLLLVLGLRRGEAAAALWKDVDDLEGDHPTWRIPPEVRKGRVAGSKGERRELLVPLSPLAVRVLKELQGLGSPKVFPKLSLGDVGKWTKTATDLEDVTLHDLRRSCGSGLQRLGAPPSAINVVLGHAEKGVAQADAHYTHGGRHDEHREWLRRWSDHLEKLIGREPGSVVAFPKQRGKRV